MQNLKQRSDLDASFIEHINECPYCQSRTHRQIASEAGFDYSQCADCRLIFLRQRLRHDCVSLLYNDTYHADINNRYEEHIAERRLRLLSFSKPGMSIHEDGAGVGSFIYIARQHGHNATGSDLGADSIQKAKELFGVNLSHGSIDSLGIQDHSLDGFVCFNLLSHLYAPWTYIAQVSQLLKPGGKFLFRTGDRRGYFKTLGILGAPEHVFHFDKHWLKNVLVSQGFTLHRVIPAFDSDFPLSVIMTGRERKDTSSITRMFSKNLHRIWTNLRLPREDAFFLAEKR